MKNHPYLDRPLRSLAEVYAQRWRDHVEAIARDLLADLLRAIKR